MSERDANEKRKIPVGKLASLVHSAVNKNTVPQQADASEEGQGPKEPERGKDPESKRVRELVKLLTAAIDSNDAKTDEKIIALARNLSERKRSLIQIAAVKIKQTEERTEVALDQFTDRIVTFHDVLTKTLKEGNAQKALERAQKTLDDIHMSYWDRFVKGVNDTYQNKLDDAKQQIQGVLDKATDNFSKQIAALLDKSIREVQSPVGSLKLRAFRERRLLIGALVLGLMLGSVLGIMRHTLWNSAEVASRQALRVFGPFVLPLSGRSEQ